MALVLARSSRSPRLRKLASALVPIGLALGCGSTFTPADGTDGSDFDGAASGGEESSGGGGTAAGPGAGGSASGGSSGGAMPTDSPPPSGGTTSTGGVSSSGGDAGGDGDGGSDGSGGEADPGEGYDCNLEHILCLPIIAPEPCPPGESYAVESSCYGPCVPIEQCECTSAADCPDPNGTDEYACHGTTDRCGPWLR